MAEARVTADRPPIPEELWAKVLEFLAAGKTGEVLLYVKAGRVINGQLTEKLPRVLDSA